MATDIEPALERWVAEGAREFGAMGIALAAARLTGTRALLHALSEEEQAQGRGALPARTWPGTLLTFWVTADGEKLGMFDQQVIDLGKPGWMGRLAERVAKQAEQIKGGNVEEPNTLLGVQREPIVDERQVAYDRAAEEVGLSDDPADMHNHFGFNHSHVGGRAPHGGHWQITASPACAGSGDAVRDETGDAGKERGDEQPAS